MKVDPDEQFHGLGIFEYCCKTRTMLQRQGMPYKAHALLANNASVEGPVSQNHCLGKKSATPIGALRMHASFSR